MKFRKKPVVIEAEQWFPDKPVKGVTWPAPAFMAVDSSKGCIHTFEGNRIVCSGDWIITGVNGKKYPCKPDIFEQAYEKVEE